MSLLKHLDIILERAKTWPNWMKTPETNETLSEERVSDISEPVLSFVKTVKESPKRFKIKPAANDQSNDVYEIVPWNDDVFIWRGYLVDLEINKEFYFCYVTSRDWLGNLYYLPEFLTSDEKYYISKELIPIFLERRTRRENLLKIREERRIKKETLIRTKEHQKERQKYIEIYCNG